MGYKAPLFQVSELIHQYGEHTVLSIDSWQLMPHEHQLLLGPSGSGKTTLLGILSGLLRPTKGTVEALDISITDINSSELSTFRARNFGFVFQDHHLVSSLTVSDNLSLARHLAGLSDDRPWAEHLLNQLGISEHRDSRPANLSHGEAQRAAIARAAVTRPPLILADEPSSALDDDNAARVMELLRTLSEEVGSTMLVASHDSRLKSLFTTSLMLEKLEQQSK